MFTESVPEFAASMAGLTGLALTLFAAFRTPIVLRRIAALPALYGRIPQSLSNDLARYARLGPLAYLQLAPFLLLLAGAAAYLASEPWDWRIHHPVHWGIFYIGALSVSFVINSEIAVAPTILLLGPSCPEVERELDALNADLPRHRTLALVRPGRASLSAIGRWRVLLNNYRTRDLYQWRSIVFHLMDVVPVVVLCDDLSEPVVEERERLSRRGYQDRVITTRKERLSDPDERRRLRDEIVDRMSRVRDQRHREARQEQFSAMRASVPMILWYPRTLRDTVAKASCLSDYAISGFFRTFKTVGGRGYDDLIEDAPSRADRAEELQYLREDRTLEEMEILLRSAEESVVKLSPAADFNCANLACKWGILARYRGEWDLAEERFAKAIAMLEPLTETGRRAMAFQELGSAWFHRGDVALARYRESRLPECLAFARSCYERSVECDSLGGGNTDLARRRLEDCRRG